MCRTFEPNKKIGQNQWRTLHEILGVGAKVVNFSDQLALVLRMVL